MAVITLTVAQHLAGGGSPYPRYFFPVLGVLAALAAVGFDRLVPRLLPAVVVAAMAWWAIKQMPIGVDPVFTRRPRDNGAVPPPALRVLPVGDGWRMVAAGLIGVGAVVVAPSPVASASRGGGAQPCRRVRHPMATELRTRSLVVLGLSSLAVAQPLLDLFGRNPEFFVAGNYSTGQIVWFALLITLVPPLVGIAAIAIATLINRRAGTVVYAIVVAVLGAAFVLAVLRTIGVDPVVLVVVVALAGGVGVPSCWPCERTPGGCCCPTSPSPTSRSSRMFLFASPTVEARSPAAAAATSANVTMPELGGPVVVSSSTSSRRRRSCVRTARSTATAFPGFAELASVSTWFRNASSQHNLTHRAVPSILDGRLAADGTLPTYTDHPRNLFTLLGGEVPVHSYESVTSLCPPDICAEAAPLPADAGARGRLDRLRPSGASRRAARRAAADRQLVGRLRRPGGRRRRRQLHPRRLLALARARRRRAQPARPGRQC